MSNLSAPFPNLRIKKSHLALDHVFLIAMNLFDSTHEGHAMDFYLSTGLLRTTLELEDREWEKVLAKIEAELNHLFELKISGVAVSCRTQGSITKLTFSDPSYHDLQLAEVIIQDLAPTLTAKLAA